MEQKEHAEKILEVSHLKKYFQSGKKTLKAVDDVTFSLNRGETLGIVGESGCGKTTCARTCIGIYDRTEGQVLYRGKNVHELRGAAKKAFTKEVQIIFQDPYSSLDPKMKVHDIIAEGLRAHKLCRSREEERQRVKELLLTVGLNVEHAARFVHEFSGGQRQRIGIARALAVDPELIVCDEPISALDVSIQAQIVNLLMRLQREKGLTYLFIAHGLNVVKHISDRVGVMYLGKLMEVASKKEIYDNPLNPYTQALLSAIPSTDVLHKKERIILSGDVPTPINPPKGCRFCSRCFKKMGTVCDEQIPELHDVGGGHMVACHLYDEKM